jgi:hypothetical protein
LRSSILDPQSSILYFLPSILYSIFSILIFSLSAFAQNPAGREAPKPARTDKNKSAANPDKSAGNAKVDKPRKPARRSSTGYFRAGLRAVARNLRNERGFDEV